MGMPLVIVPLTSLATSHIGPQQSGSASALYNMFRNLGGSIGIALLATQLDVREKFHSVRLGEAVNAFSSAAGERLDALARGFIAQGADPVSAGQQALGAVAGVVRREAYVMAYGYCFFLIGAVLLAMVLLVWLCRGTEREHVAGLHGSNGLGPRHAGAPTARVGRYLSQRAVLIPG